MSWTAKDIPSQRGRVAVVTGANGGLGLATARALAAAGTHVVMAARDVGKADAAREDIRRADPDAAPEVVPLDLASLASVADAAARIRSAHERIDLLICNAGLMAPPESRTEDGFELQFGVNHLGHWALASHLLPAVVRAPGARVVTVTSWAQHVVRRMDLDDPHMRHRYDPWLAYSRSKLANRYFAQGLQAQFRRTGVDGKALTAHPGMTASELQVNAVRAGGAGASATFFHLWSEHLGMPVERGALSVLRAATDPQAPGGAMYGPLFGTNGPPVRKPLVRPGAARAIDTLWEVSRRETGLDVDVAAAVRAG